MAQPVHVPFLRRVAARDTAEEHRVATPLELFFDLVFVVAIAAGAGELHHGLAEGHLEALRGFGFVFFAIWWAWMNYTWFSSAYDPADVIHRLLTFVIMTGSLVLAAGVPDLFEDGQSLLTVLGYTVMRVGMVVMWLRAAAGHPERRRTCLAYAAGIALVQVFWLLRLALDGSGVLLATFLVGVVLELAVPWASERLGGPTPYHPEHIAERYSLFTIIVLGEVVLSSVGAVQGALDHPDGDLLMLVAGGLLMVFSLWWLYFKRDHAELFSGPRWTHFVAGYGHVFLFASVAAAGASVAAALDVLTHHAHASPRFVGLALALSLATYAVTLGSVHAVAASGRGDLLPALLVAAALLVVPLLAAGIGPTVLLLGLVLASVVVLHVALSRTAAA